MYINISYIFSWTIFKFYDLCCIATFSIVEDLIQKDALYLIIKCLYSPLTCSNFINLFLILAFLKSASQVSYSISFDYESNIFLIGEYLGNGERGSSEQGLHR